MAASEHAASEIWSVDGEWGFRDGRVDQESAFVPVVVCFVGLRSGRRVHFWGRDAALGPFVRQYQDDLFVAHNMVAEAKYLLRLGVPLPHAWFDTHAAWRVVTNRPFPPKAGLSDALHSLGLPGLAPAAKKELQQKILYLRFDQDNPADRREIVDYCFGDCIAAGALHARLEDQVRPALMAWWAEYLKAVARMELRGIPFDAGGYEAIVAGREEVRTRLTDEVNRTSPVYCGGSFSENALLRWCRREGIEWPVKVSPTTGLPYHVFDKDTFKGMEGRHPFIAKLRQVRKTLAQLNDRTLVVDPTRRRHYFSTWPFRSVTGRNQPRDFVFGAPKWMRYLIQVESPDHLLVYVDFVAQEVGIAAALSGDLNLRAVYDADDCHMAFAVRAGAAPMGATKKTHPHVRKQYKTVNLGVLYGQSAYGIAARLGIPREQAQKILDDHRALFPWFWRWSERSVQGAFDRGWITTPCGWRSRVPLPSNERTWMNFPIQGAGADIMRLVVTYLDRQNVQLLAPVHDGFLMTCRREQLAPNGLSASHA